MLQKHKLPFPCTLSNQSLIVEQFHFVLWRLLHDAGQIVKINSLAGGFHIYCDVYRWRAGETEHQVWIRNEDGWSFLVLKLQGTESFTKSM